MKIGINIRIIINLVILLIIVLNTLYLALHYRQLQRQEEYLRIIIGTLNEPVEYTVEAYED